MFDTSKGVEMSLPAPAGFKNATVNYPTDEHLIARAAEQNRTDEAGEPRWQALGLAGGVVRN
jgi:hypothetical protein